MVLAAILACALATSASNSSDDKSPLGEVAEHAVQQSKLTLPGSKAFHLKAELLETTNPSSEYQAKIEQYWIAPDKWRRTIESPGFSQTLIVNGSQILESDSGDYFPWWLNDLVTAINDPLPMLEVLKQSDAQVRKPSGGENANTCADLRTRDDRSVFCFEGSHGLLSSVFTQGYNAEFKDFKSFADKRVARLLLIDPEPGTTIQARITELTTFRGEDESLFAIAKPTSLVDRIKTIRIGDATLRSLAGNTEIAWPPVGSGPTSGQCAVYISADRAGHMREVWPAGCDNAGLQDPLREMVKKWQLKPATENGIPVQIEALASFRFETKLVSKSSAVQDSDQKQPKPEAAPKESHGPTKFPVVQPRVTKMVKPDCSTGQSCHGVHGEVVVVVTVLEDGTAGEVTAMPVSTGNFSGEAHRDECGLEVQVLITGKPVQH